MSTTEEMLHRCLEDLDRRIDDDEEQTYHAAWSDFLHDRIGGTGMFVAPRRTPHPPLCDWPTICVNDTLYDRDAMLLHQFKGVSDTLAAGGGTPLGVRCNYGVGIMTSQLGCALVEMDREQGNTPTTRALDGIEAIDDVIQGGVPDLRSGQGGHVFDTGAYFQEVMDRYPAIKQWVSLYHPDAQGPIDNAELAWGSSIFYAFYDCPDRVRAFLELMTDHYLAFLGKWFEMVPPRNDYSVHWGLMHKGNIVLRDDSLMNLSPDIFKEYIRPHEERCLVELGGGAVHYCGRGEHFIEAVSEMRGLTAVHISQPELNDMSTIYANTIDKGIPVVGMKPDCARQAGRDLRGRVHVY